MAGARVRMLYLGKVSPLRRDLREREQKRKLRAAGETKADSTHYQPLHTHTETKACEMNKNQLLSFFAFCCATLYLHLMSVCVTHRHIFRIWFSGWSAFRPSLKCSWHVLDIFLQFSGILCIYNPCALSYNLFKVFISHWFRMSHTLHLGLFAEHCEIIGCNTWLYNVFAYFSQAVYRGLETNLFSSKCV